MANADPRPTLEAPDDDPYLWLEEIDGERALGWVEAQNTATLARFGDARFAADRDTLAAIYDRPDNIPVIARRGARVFNFWKDAVHPRGLWRASPLLCQGIHHFLSDVSMATLSRRRSMPRKR